MPLIRADQARPALKDAVVLDLGDIGAQAAKLRMAAEARASRILADAEKRAAALVQGAEEKGLEQGRARGVEQGLAEGREQGKAEALEQVKEQLLQLHTAWSDVAEQWDEHRGQMEREARQAVLDFALRFAERLTHRVVEVDRSIIVDQVANALALVMRPLDVVVQIHPEDRPLLDEALPELLAEFSHLEHVHLATDDSISRGGCVVTYGQGQIDARLEVQMNRILDMILPADAREQQEESSVEPSLDERDSSQPPPDDDWNEQRSEAEH